MWKRLLLIGGLSGVLGLVWIAVGPTPTAQPGSSGHWQWPWHPTVSSPEQAEQPLSDGSDVLSDPSRSLRAVYDGFERSSDPAERSLAWHAWSVCVPNFITDNGRLPSDDRLAEGLPRDDMQPARLNARRMLAARCQGFSSESHDAVLQAAARNNERHRAGDLRSRGELALEAIQAGNDEESIRLIREIVERKSPYELRDLSGVVTRWHRQSPQATDSLRDAVLAVIGCDFGMDCSDQSTLSLELCAYGASCQGDFAERALTAFPDIDRMQLNALRVETARAIREGRFDPIAYFDPPQN